MGSKSNIARFRFDEHELLAAGVKEQEPLPLHKPAHPGLTQRQYLEWLAIWRAVGYGAMVLIAVAGAVAIMVWR